MSIQLVTYANQTVTPTNDAIIYEKALDQNGIFHGCNVTVSGNTVNITSGYGAICGREFVIQNEAIAVTLAPSGMLLGRLYVRMDLADADAPIQLLTATGNTLPPLQQDDDVNFVNGTWEMELATFDVGVSSLSDCVETFETITGSKEVPTIIADYIVEQGTTGIWTYRKWNSGVAECWGKDTQQLKVNNAWGSMFISTTITTSFPTDLFNAPPVTQIYASSGYLCMINNGNSSPTKDVVTYGFFRATAVSTTETYFAHIYARGTWK